MSNKNKKGVRIIILEINMFKQVLFCKVSFDTLQEPEDFHSSLEHSENSASGLIRSVSLALHSQRVTNSPRWPALSCQQSLPQLCRGSAPGIRALRAMTGPR